jgi:hypothetical protein
MWRSVRTHPTGLKLTEDEIDRIRNTYNELIANGTIAEPPQEMEETGYFDEPGYVAIRYFNTEEEHTIWRNASSTANIGIEWPTDIIHTFEEVSE